MVSVTTDACLSIQTANSRICVYGASLPVHVVSRRVAHFVGRWGAMADIVTQLQDSVNEINGMFYNCTGMLQRDAKPAGTTADGELSDALPDDGLEASEKQIKVRAPSSFPPGFPFLARPKRPVNASETDIYVLSSQEMAAALIQQSRKIDELASLLPEVDLDEPAQLGRIAKLQAENDELDKELARELEASEKVLSKATAAFEAATNKVLLTEEQPSTTSK